jgi:hypothetical protein
MRERKRERERERESWANLVVRALENTYSVSYDSCFSVPLSFLSPLWGQTQATYVVGT